MIHIGIDNGLSGAIVVIDSNHNIISKTVMPIINGKRKAYDIKKIADILKKIKEEADANNEKVCAMIEKAMIIPVSGRLSLFSSGFCFGMFQGILTTLNISYEIARPQDWQKDILKGLNLKDTKQMSILWCKRKFPKEDWRATKLSVKDHHGLCDAACMAYYSFLRNKA